MLEKSLLNSFPGASQQIGVLFIYRHKKNEFKNDLGSLSPRGVKALAYCNSEVLKFHYPGGKKGALIYINSTLFKRICYTGGNLF